MKKKLNFVEKLLIKKCIKKFGYDNCIVKFSCSKLDDFSKSLCIDYIYLLKSKNYCVKG